MSFQMVLLPVASGNIATSVLELLQPRAVALSGVGFGTMSFQMVLLHLHVLDVDVASFGTMSFQMVLLPTL